MSDTKVQSSVEEIKRASDYLRGDLYEDLNAEPPSVTEASEQLLKFHGIYAQDNRDVRRERALAKEVLDYIFMIRVVVPGGRLSSDQWLALDEIASTHADGSIRLTTRQAVQFHGVLKGDLRALAGALDSQFLSSFGGCGDVVRNVVTCPSLQMGEFEGLGSIARELRETFRSTSLAHWEIFVNGEKAASREEVQEHPFYGNTYLPRKFKIAVTHPHENCVDVFAQDVGLVPHIEGGTVTGFTLLVGGGLGRSYAHEGTFARLAEPLGFVTTQETSEAIAAIVTTYRDLGDRGDRKRARLKYVVADMGLDAFKSEVERRLGHSLAAPKELSSKFGSDDHLGWRLHGDSWQLGVRVGAGRVRDSTGGSQLRSALRKIATHYRATFFITPQQDMIISGVKSGDRAAIDQLLKEHQVRGESELGSVERNALACPALPTCGQALAESERRLEELVRGVEGALDSRQLRRPLQLRLTGCPNGCARPAVAEVGVVGRTKSTYDLYLGGGPSGDRLASLYQEKVKLEDIPEVLGPLFDRWKTEGTDEESFGDFVQRTGIA